MVEPWLKRGPQLAMALTAHADLTDGADRSE
jgi:hypothetical protein